MLEINELSADVGIHFVYLPYCVVVDPKPEMYVESWFSETYGH